MKKLLLLFAYHLGLITIAFPQEIEWQNTIGGNSQDELFSISPTTDGGYICGGQSSSNSSGDKSENSQGGEDYWIVKLNSTGNIEWENTIGGSGNESLYTILQTLDGGYICGGGSYSDSSGDKSENNSGSMDYWIIKLNAAGSIQWQNSIGGSNFENLPSIQQTSDGGCILGGFSNSNISGDKTENSMGGYDYWVIKLDSSGNIQWQNTIGGSGDDHLYSIQETSDGGYICGGISKSNISGNKTENCKGGYDYWIIKLNSSGYIQWQNTIGGNADDIITSIAQSTDGGYLCGGYSQSNISGDKTENCLGDRDYWVVKIDSIGVIQWQNTIGGIGVDQLNSISKTDDGGCICGGFSNSSYSADKQENCIGIDDYWIVKLDSAGNIEWENTIGGIDEDELHSISKTAEGDYICGGSSFSNIFCDKSENNTGPVGFDYWVVKVTGKYNLITGKLFIDANSNGLQDIGEPDVIRRQIAEINTNRFTFSNQMGQYNLVVLDSGNFTVVPPYLNYYTSIPATHTSNFSGIHQTDSLNNFAFQPTGIFNDLCVTITPMGNFRANMHASYMINYENVGTTTLNGTVIFFPDDDVTFVSSNITPTSVTTDSVVWSVGTLTPFQTGSILVTVHVNAGTPIGTLINSSVEIDPVAGDANTACNYNAWEVYTTGAIDPNAILVDRDTVLITELSSPPYLNYIIYFQNTGNDTAFNARVLNNIPQKLDVNSFEFVASSHPVNINYSAGSRLFTFNFDNINLPDSNANEPASHGFIRYRIKPKNTLVAGDSINNTAFIYFDFNSPVMTDTAVTEIVLPTNLTPGPSPKERGVTLAPNPATNTLTIKLPQLTTDHCQLITYDLFGREVLRREVGGQKSEFRIDVTGLAKGIYLIEINSAEKIYRGKFVKE